MRSLALCRPTCAGALLGDPDPFGLGYLFSPSKATASAKGHRRRVLAIFGELNR